MKTLLPTALLLTSLTAPLAQAQVKRGGGLFGFNKNAEQISAGLFPTDAPAAMPVSDTRETAAPAAPSAPASSQSSSDGNPIFRNGSPQQIDEVSYTVPTSETAMQKVEKAKKRPSFFSFGKKSEPAPSQPVIAPLPPTTAPPAPLEAATERAETAVRETVTEAEQVADEAMETVQEATQPAPIPDFAQPAKEEKGGFMSFFSRKKKSSSEPPANATDPQIPTVVASEDGTYEVTNPNMPALPAPTSSDRDGGLLPIGKIRGEKKAPLIDMTGAETIIQNGEIVAPDDTGFVANVAPEGDGVKDPPKVINGVKTYSSWEDVDAAPVSAADKILNRIR